MPIDPEHTTREDALKAVIEVAKPDDAIADADLDAVSGGGGRIMPHGLVGGGSA